MAGGAYAALSGLRARIEQLDRLAADITNALMAIPNLISLIVLRGVIVEETRAHLWNDQH